MNAPIQTAPLPSISDVEDAAKRLRGVSRITPLLESPLLNERLGWRLLVKAECLQLTGSFKFRGAYNRISRLTPEERARGIVAFSSGNHAQGAAYAAKMCNAPAVIVMPADAPAIKVANTRAYGAEVVLYDRYKESREAIGQRYAGERGMTLVPPFDDPYILCGQGTIGLEVAAQCAERDILPDIMIAPASGGGLISGIALAMQSRLPSCQVYSAEPHGYDDVARSLASGRIEKNPADLPATFCDALMAPAPGNITFGVMQPILKGGLSATDAEIETAIATLFHYLKIVVEPGGAAGIAALLAGRIGMKGRTAVAVASGGNIDPDLYARILSTAKPV